MPELAGRFEQHVIQKHLLDPVNIFLALQLEFKGILDRNLELPACALESAENFLINLTIATTLVSHLLIGHDPFSLAKGDRLLYRQSLEHLLIDVNHIALVKDLRSAEDSALGSCRCRGDLEAPLLDRLLAHQSVEHRLDFLHALPRSQLSLHQGVSHTRAFAHTIGQPLQHRELGWQIHVSLTHPDDEERLSHITHVQLVHLREVLSDRDLCTIVAEFMLADRLLKVDVVHDVGALGSPVPDDALAIKLELDQLLELEIVSGTISDLVDFLQTRSRRHELEDAVDRQSASKLCLESTRLEPRHNQELLSLKINRGLSVEESR